MLINIVLNNTRDRSIIDFLRSASWFQGSLISDFYSLHFIKKHIRLGIELQHSAFTSSWAWKHLEQVEIAA